MRPSLKTAVSISAGIAGSAAAAAAVGSRLWDQATARAIEDLYREPAASEPELFSLELLEGLPAPVARYFEFALTPGQPLTQGARLVQRGKFRVGGFEAPWRPLAAVQHVSLKPPGFVWDARIRVAPFLDVRVRDTYVRGTGVMQARLASLVPVAEESSRPELTAGALHRYLAEAVWVPPALLPGQGVVWEAIGDHTARATLTDAGTTVSLEFRFGDDGSIQHASTPERYRAVDGAFVRTPWECVYKKYVRIGQVFVPRKGEVAWVLPEGRLPYWKGRIIEIDCEPD